MAKRLVPQITKVALVDAGANPDADLVFYKAAEPPATQPDQEASMATDDISKADLEAVATERDELRAEIKALNELSNDDLAALRGFEIAKADPQEEVLKGLPEDVRKRLEDSEAKIAKMEADQRVETFQKAAAEKFAKVGDTDEIGAALAGIADDSVRESVEKALASANERIDLGKILKVAGTDGDAETDPMAKVKARATEIRTDDPAISVADAYSQAMRENPEAAREAFAR